METKKIYLGPLQGFTNYVFRNLQHKYFGGVDKYYSPYLRFEPQKAYKKSSLKDLLPENNEALNFVPQLLGTDVDQFVELAQQMKSFGYQEVNWNLGCPYPMVTKRGFGSALVQRPEQVKEILSKVLDQIDIPLSIKCRLGYEQDDEIYELLEVLNQFPLKELCIHTRTGKQLYKGTANKEAFVPLIDKTKHLLIYNGDIKTHEHIQILDELFDHKINHFMIGRGLLMDPFLASEYKGQLYTKQEKKALLIAFHEELFASFTELLEPSHILTKMVSQWEYLSYIFENQHKSFKLIKKCSNIKKYTAVVDGLLNAY